jgi:hypothetical protein
MASVNSATSDPYERFLRGRKFKEILLKCSVISGSRIVTKVPRKAVPFGQFARFKRAPGKHLRDEDVCPKWLTDDGMMDGRLQRRESFE